MYKYVYVFHASPPPSIFPGPPAFLWAGREVQLPLRSGDSQAPQSWRSAGLTQPGRSGEAGPGHSSLLSQLESLLLSRSYGGV